MPSLVPLSRCMPLGSSTAPALVVALLATAGASSLGAQAPTFGTDINAAAETERDRAPLFFGSALVAPKGYFGVSLLGTAGSADRLTPMPGGLGTEYARTWGTTVSAVWGATSRLTLGAQLGVGRTSRDVEWTAPLEVGGPPVSRRVASTTTEPTDLRVHARYQLLERNGGATRIALNASLAWPQQQAGYSTVGLAVAQRVGRVTFHLAQDLRFRDGVPRRTFAFVDDTTTLPGRNGLALDVRGAMVVPLSRRVSWSLEGIGTNVGARSSVIDQRLAEVGTGFRLDLGRVKLDLGYRQQVWGTTDSWHAPAKRRLVLGTHWTF